MLNELSDGLAECGGSAQWGVRRVRSGDTGMVTYSEEYHFLHWAIPRCVRCCQVHISPTCTVSGLLQRGAITLVHRSMCWVLCYRVPTKEERGNRTYCSRVMLQ